MKCISIRQPWAWLIIHGGKDIENRTWKTSLTGTVLIHASASMTRTEWQNCFEFVNEFNPKLALKIPISKALDKGGFIGQVTLVGCVSESDSPWFIGPWGHVYKDPIPIKKFEPYTGSLGYFDF